MTALVLLLTLVLLAAGTPLFAVFGALSLWLFWRLPNTPLSAVANDVFSEKFADSPLLVTIPLFTFAGVLLSSSGAPGRLVSVSRALLGWLPGGLAVVCLIASAIFTTFTGGSGVTIVAIGGLLFPALVEERYTERFSLGLVTTGGSLGVLFPPSIPVILYGVVGGVDIEGLFFAAALPGVITVVALSVYASVVGANTRVARSPFDPRAALSALWQSRWEVALPPLLIGGLAFGLLRIHEAAAFTALYVLVIEVFVYREVRMQDVPRIARQCVVLVGAILVILAAAIGLTAFLIQDGVPQKILDGMQTWIGSRATFLIALNAFLLVVGMTMDIFSAIIVVVPLIVPIANHFDVNPYHLGAIFLLNLEIGYLTPPLGLNLFISGFRFGQSVTRIYRAVLPFVLLLALALGVVTFVPGLSTWSSRLVEPLRIAPDPELALPPGGEPVTLDDLLPDPEATPGGEPATLEDLLAEPDGTTGSEPPSLEDLLAEPEAAPAGDEDPATLEEPSAPDEPPQPDESSPPLDTKGKGP